MNSTSTTQLYPKQRQQQSQKIRHKRSHTPMSIYTINKSESTTAGFQSNQAQELKSNISQALFIQNENQQRLYQLQNSMNADTMQTFATKKALSNTMLLLIKGRTRVASAQIKSQIIKNIQNIQECEATHDVWAIQNQILKQRKFLKSAQQCNLQEKDLIILPSVQINSSTKNLQQPQQQLIYCSKDLQGEIAQNFASSKIGMKRAQSSKLVGRNLQSGKSLNRIQEQYFQLSEESSSQISSQKESKVIQQGKITLSKEAQKYFSEYKFQQIQNLLNEAQNNKTIQIDRPEQSYKRGCNVANHLKNFCRIKSSTITRTVSKKQVQYNQNLYSQEKIIHKQNLQTKKNETKQDLNENQLQSNIFKFKKTEQEKIIPITTVIEEPQEQLTNYDEEELLKQKRQQYKNEETFWISRRLEFEKQLVQDQQLAKEKKEKSCSKLSIEEIMQIKGIEQTSVNKADDNRLLGMNKVELRKFRESLNNLEKQ